MYRICITRSHFNIVLQLDQELQECLEEIRTFPGYADFFASQAMTEIQETAAGGSRVFANVAELRGSIQHHLYRLILPCKTVDWLQVPLADQE